MNAIVTCEKCGKPLGVFDGNICADCSKIDAIRQEIEERRKRRSNRSPLIDGTYLDCLQIIDRHMRVQNDNSTDN